MLKKLCVIFLQVLIIKLSLSYIIQPQYDPTYNSVYQNLDLPPPKPISKPKLTQAVTWEAYNDYAEKANTGTYSFGYDLQDPFEDNVQYRNEEKWPNGTVTGSYGYLQPNGNIHVVNYIADKFGYRAVVETYPRDGTLKLRNRYKTRKTEPFEESLIGKNILNNVYSSNDVYNNPNDYTNINNFHDYDQWSNKQNNIY